MWSGKHSNLLLLSFILFSVFHAPAFAIKKSYIVYMGSHEHGEGAKDADFDRVTQTHLEFVQSYVGSYEKAKESIIYSYTRHINGFAVMLEEKEAADIANHPDVVSVSLNKGRKLHTTHSWNFMDLEQNDGVIPSDSLFRKARYGEDTIIANLDTARCQRLPDSSALLSQPLLQQQNLFTEIEHEVQAHREKSSPLEKEILGLKSSFSRRERMVQTKLQSRPISEAKAIEAIIISLKEKVDKLEKSLDGEIIGRVADKRIYSSVFSKQGLALKRLEEKNSEVEKEIAELKTRVDEMTSTMVDMASVIAELKLESIQPKEILGLKSSFSRLERMAIEAIIIGLKEKVDKLEKTQKSLDGEIIGRVADKRIYSSVFSKQGLALKRLEEKNSEVEKEIAEPKTRVDEMTSTMVDMASGIAELKLESIQPKEANESTRVRITEMGMMTLSKEVLIVLVILIVSALFVFFLVLILFDQF